MAPKRRAAAAAAAKQPAADADKNRKDVQHKPAAKRQRKAAGSGGGGKTGAGGAPAAAAAPAAAQGAGQRGQQFFLMKSEPDVFSIDDLAARPQQTEPWDGVRNHQAKKVLQSMRLGDRAFFYHSNAKPPGIVGIVEIVKEAYPDPSQFDASAKYYDASAKEEAPKWFMVDCRLVRRLARQIPLDELKRHGGSGDALADMALLKYGRLSVQPVTQQQWEFVLGLEEEQQAGDG